MDYFSCSNKKKKTKKSRLFSKLFPKRSKKSEREKDDLHADDLRGSNDLDEDAWRRLKAMEQTREISALKNHIEKLEDQLKDSKQERKIENTTTKNGIVNNNRAEQKAVNDGNPLGDTRPSGFGVGEVDEDGGKMLKSIVDNIRKPRRKLSDSATEKFVYLDLEAEDLELRDGNRSQDLGDGGNSGGKPKGRKISRRFFKRRSGDICDIKEVENSEESVKDIDKSKKNVGLAVDGENKDCLDFSVKSSEREHAIDDYGEKEESETTDAVVVVEVNTDDDSAKDVRLILPDDGEGFVDQGPRDGPKGRREGVYHKEEGDKEPATEDDGVCKLRKENRVSEDDRVLQGQGDCPTGEYGAAEKTRLQSGDQTENGCSVENKLHGDYDTEEKGVCVQNRQRGVFCTEDSRSEVSENNKLQENHYVDETSRSSESRLQEKGGDFGEENGVSGQEKSTTVVEHSADSNLNEGMMARIEAENEKLKKKIATLEEDIWLSNEDKVNMQAMLERQKDKAIRNLAFRFEDINKRTLSEFKGIFERKLSEVNEEKLVLQRKLEKAEEIRKDFNEKCFKEKQIITEKKVTELEDQNAILKQRCRKLSATLGQLKKQADVERNSLEKSDAMTQTDFDCDKDFGVQLDDSLQSSLRNIHDDVKNIANSVGALSEDIRSISPRDLPQKHEDSHPGSPLSEDLITERAASEYQSPSPSTSYDNDDESFRLNSPNHRSDSFYENYDSVSPKTEIQEQLPSISEDMGVQNESQEIFEHDSVGETLDFADGIEYLSKGEDKKISNENAGDDKSVNPASDDADSGVFGSEFSHISDNEIESQLYRIENKYRKITEQMENYENSRIRDVFTENCSSEILPMITETQEDSRKTKRLDLDPEIQKLVDEVNLKYNAYFYASKA